MGRIVANDFISLDGVVEHPENWHFPYFDDAMGQIVGAGMQTQTAYLFGRRNYDEWAAVWPGRGDDDPFSTYLNALPKFVVTHRPVDGPLWNNTTVLDDDPAGKLRELKASHDGDIAVPGSATTVQWLLAEGLLDELSLLIHPIVVGSGQRLFDQGGTVPLTLAESTTLPSGVIHARYQAVR